MEKFADKECFQALDELVRSTCGSYPGFSEIKNLVEDVLPMNEWALLENGTAQDEKNSHITTLLEGLRKDRPVSSGENIDVLELLKERATRALNLDDSAKKDQLMAIKVALNVCQVYLHAVTGLVRSSLMAKRHPILSSDLIGKYLKPRGIVKGANMTWPGAWLRQMIECGIFYEESYGVDDLSLQLLKISVVNGSCELFCDINTEEMPDREDKRQIALYFSNTLNSKLLEHQPIQLHPEFTKLKSDLFSKAEEDKLSEQEVALCSALPGLKGLTNFLKKYTPKEQEDQNKGSGDLVTSAINEIAKEQICYSNLLVPLLVRIRVRSLKQENSKQRQLFLTFCQGLASAILSVAFAVHSVRSAGLGWRWCVGKYAMDMSLSSEEASQKMVSDIISDISEDFIGKQNGLQMEMNSWLHRCNFQFVEVLKTFCYGEDILSKKFGWSGNYEYRVVREDFITTSDEEENQPLAKLEKFLKNSQRDMALARVVTGGDQSVLLLCKPQNVDETGWEEKYILPVCNLDRFRTLLWPIRQNDYLYYTRFNITDDLEILDDRERKLTRSLRRTKTVDTSKFARLTEQEARLVLFAGEDVDDEELYIKLGGEDLMKRKVWQTLSRKLRELHESVSSCNDFRVQEAIQRLESFISYIKIFGDVVHCLCGNRMTRNLARYWSNEDVGVIIQDSICAHQDNTFVNGGTSTSGEHKKHYALDHVVMPITKNYRWADQVMLVPPGGYQFKDLLKPQVTVIRDGKEVKYAFSECGRLEIDGPFRHFRRTFDIPKVKITGEVKLGPVKVAVEQEFQPGTRRATKDEARILDLLTSNTEPRLARLALASAHRQGLTTNETGACYLPKATDGLMLEHVDAIDLRVFSGMDAYYRSMDKKLFLKLEGRQLELTHTRDSFYHVHDVTFNKLECSLVRLEIEGGLLGGPGSAPCHIG